jgi:hypothetical protein
MYHFDKEYLVKIKRSARSRPMSEEEEDILELTCQIAFIRLMLISKSCPYYTNQIKIGSMAAKIILNCFSF